MAAVNDALRLVVGRRYRVLTKERDTVQGRCMMASSERAVIVSRAGSFTVYTGEVLRLDNLDAVRPL